MTGLIIVGHGAYGTAIEKTLCMLMGTTPGVSYLDFTEKDTIETLAEKLKDKAGQYEGEVLIACDLAGGSPYRQSCLLCTQRPGTLAVVGLNMAAYAEMANNLNLPAEELLEFGVEVAQNTIARFPEKAKETV